MPFDGSVGLGTELRGSDEGHMYRLRLTVQTIRCHAGWNERCWHRKLSDGGFPILESSSRCDCRVQKLMTFEEKNPACLSFGALVLLSSRRLHQREPTQPGLDLLLKLLW
nr:hypothetical protein CFP56_72405 [Quercus suber]